MTTFRLTLSHADADGRRSILFHANSDQEAEKQARRLTTRVAQHNAIKRGGPVDVHATWEPVSETTTTAPAPMRSAPIKPPRPAAPPGPWDLICDYFVRERHMTLRDAQVAASRLLRWREV